MKATSLGILLVFLMLIAACSQDVAEGKMDINAGISDTLAIPIVALAEETDVEIEPGLTMRVLQKGTGAVADVGDKISVHYTGWLHDGSAKNSRGVQIDSSVDRGRKFEFTLGAGHVLPGWDNGIVGMKVGEIRELTMAPQLAFGQRGSGEQVPPGSTLVFEISLETVASAVKRSNLASQSPIVANGTMETQPAVVDATSKLKEFGNDALKSELRRSLVRQWAEDGHAGAQSTLGRGYRFGHGFPIDLKKAIGWYERAAQQGDTNAQSILAHLYMGYDDPAVRNVPLALKWSHVSAERGAAPSGIALWNINSAITPQTRYLFDADDLTWLSFQLSGGETQKATNDTEEAKLVQCHAEVNKRIVECYTQIDDCDLIGCTEEVQCRGWGPYGRCGDRTYGPYGNSGDFYCDPKNSDNVDFNRDIVIRDACNGEFD